MSDSTYPYLCYPSAVSLPRVPDLHRLVYQRYGIILYSMKKKKVITKETKLVRKAARTVDELSQASVEQAAAIAWEAPEFQEYQRGWPWILGLVLVSFVLLAIFYTQDNWSAMAVVALSAVVIYQQANTRPKTIKFRVDEAGFSAGKEAIGWNELKSFWLDEASSSPHLYLETTHRWYPIRTIHLTKVDPLELQARLQQYLPEHLTRGEALTDMAIRWLKL